MKKTILIFTICTFLYSNEEFPLVSSMPSYDELEFVSYDYFPKQKDKMANKNIEKKVERDIEKQEEKAKNSIKNIEVKEKSTSKIEEKIMQNEAIIVPKIQNKLENKIENMLQNKQIIEEKITQNDIEELRDTAFKEFEASEEKNKDSNALLKALNMGDSIKHEAVNKSLQDYEELIIEVDSRTNSLTLKSIFGKKEQNLKNYTVSTAKEGVKKPLGTGRVSSVSLNPVWYPTQDTKRNFAKKGINLPNMIPANHKYNYMGAAKINLTHIVDGKQTYRIHGTLNEKSIGTKESAGCIRMRNSDVVELAKIIQDFIDNKGASRVKVILL